MKQNVKVLILSE